MRLEDDEVYNGLRKEMSQQETRKASSHKLLALKDLGLGFSIVEVYCNTTRTKHHLQ